MTSKFEFAVEMTCESCVSAIKQVLVNQKGIENFDIQLHTGTVIIETILSVNEVLSLLKSSGRKAVLKGTANTLAGVAIIESQTKQIQGVIRFMKNDNESCIIDGTVDGLKAITHSLCVYECGDISNGCESIGSMYESVSSDGKKKYSAILGTFLPGENGRTSFRFIVDLNLSDIIGRSVAITDKQKLACGIIARSAGLYQNPKMICACDGTSIWNEQSKPKL